MTPRNKILIFGPCAVESRAQLDAIKSNLQPFSAPFTHVIFRGGVWKPRTSPNTFQGAGEQALEWLYEFRETTHLPLAVEVANAKHIGALAGKIDYCWLGARTVTNPILVQELVDCWQRMPQDALPKGILIKNPMAEDTALWLGAAERLKCLNVPLLAILRGCNHQPCWGMAFAFRQAMPQIPLLLDPSHLSGDAQKIPTLCQQAMDLDFDGLMIEVHPDPPHALSDSQQQITPQTLFHILKTLSFKHATEPDKELLAMRQQIDEIDDRLWALIAQRLQLAHDIGILKKRLHQPVLQPERFAQIVARRLEKMPELNPNFVRQLLNLLHEESVKTQL